MTTQPIPIFFAHLIANADPKFRELLAGIAEFHALNQWLTPRQASAVKISASKAGLTVPPSIIIRDPETPVAAPQPQEIDEIDDSLPWDEPNQLEEITLIKSTTDVHIRPGDMLIIRGGVCTGKWE